MLVIENLSVSYTKNKRKESVLKSFDFQAKTGESVAILGSSGCGKSTLLHVLSKVVKPECGTVLFGEKNQFVPLDTKRHKIGFVPQSGGLIPWKTVEANCILPLKGRKERVTPEREEAMRFIYKELLLEDLLYKYPNQLSGGQKQRVAVARAFIFQSELLLMDEPFSALDAITREEAQKLYVILWGKIKPTTIFVTHSMEEALYLGQRICIMGKENGTIQYEVENPYFGVQTPEDASYLSIKKILRNQLLEGRSLS